MADPVAKRLLVLNAGSSTLKYAFYVADTLACLKREKLDITDGDYLGAIETILGNAENLAAVGHRVVHGGEEFHDPVLVTQDIYHKLEALIPLAPLHQPHNLKAIDTVIQAYPDLPQIACFDTAFHRSQPRVNQLYALPSDLSEQGIIRYGFHGLSYEYIASILPEHSDKADGKVIVLHLGSGASACAMLNRQSVSSTMGFTALEGLMMSTRCGTIDPGVILYLQQEKGMPLADIEALLYKQSGLLGVSGISADSRDLVGHADPKAQMAIDLFCHYAVRAIGQLAAELQGLDVLVFTAGIGENQPEIRDRITQAVSWLNPEIHVIPTNEEYIIAAHSKAVIE
ncbi:acetate/propionate family kinase [Alterisphingorhabdus coralli]|uniref:Acetate kinase n=1 Tax=Alterisphingorhabdus coralli TaxID=3071408 RepID=A0AA97F728_9SPHN|nr:acetate/propionate family kinase [Parasphingorhabdus sp. SCSIO 66989]WOE74292.1 acetate/propionate family kinase [Parasphingorhabdus sp. SCSIO 66989]